MKQLFHPQWLVFFLVIILISSSTAAARYIKGESKAPADGFLQKARILDMEQEDSLNLMGMEHCENRDEECLKRRMIAEAHLDYIYTQHQKP